MTSAEFERWLPAYRQGAVPVAAALGDLFQEALTRGVTNEPGTSIEITRSRGFLRKKRAEFPHHILFFIYSSQFDKVVESEILDTDERRAAFADSLQPVEILSRKLALLEPNFKQLIYHAHVEAGCYTAAVRSRKRSLLTRLQLLVFRRTAIHPKGRRPRGAPPVARPEWRAVLSRSRSGDLAGGRHWEGSTANHTSIPARVATHR